MIDTRSAAFPNRREIMGGLTLTCAAALSGCGLLAPTCHIKMTLMIKSLSHRWSGSSVLSIWGVPEPIKIAEGHATDVSLRGAASVVHLPDNDIFLTLHPAGPSELAGSVVQALDSSAGPGQAFLDAISTLASSSALGRTAWLPDDRWPVIVAFHDIGEPDSIFRVTNDNIGKFTGENSEIVGISLEVVGQPSSDKIIREALPWLRGKPRSLQLPKSDVGDPLHPKVNDDYILSRDFSTELR